MKVLNLDDYQPLFKDDKAYTEFVEKLREELSQSQRIIEYNGKTLAITISPDDMHGILKAALDKKIKNKDYYIVILEDTDFWTDKKGQYIYYFGIVKVDYWNKNHCLDDQGIGNGPNLPEGVQESAESVIEMVASSEEEALDLLRNYGFTVIKQEDYD